MIDNLMVLKSDLRDNDLRAKKGLRKSVGIIHLKDKIQLIEKTLKRIKVA